MKYNLYEKRKINIDKNKLDLIINKFSETSQKNGLLSINGGIKYNFINKGGQGEVYGLSINDNDELAIKRGKANDNEKKLLELMSGYVDSHVCPHFLLIYDIRTIRNKDFITMEKINGDLNNWLIEEHTDDEWLSFLFQFSVSIYVMKTYGKTYHSDLKPKNILFKNVENDMIVKYNININNNQVEYDLPLCGKLFIIGDFGHAQSLLLKTNKLATNVIKNKLEDNSDFEYVYTLTKRLQVDSIIKNYKLNSIITFFDDNNTKYKEYYDKEKRKIESEMRKYPQYIKDDMLLKSLAYFVIENNLYNKMNIEIKSKYKLPSNKIQQFILNNFNGKINPEDVLLNQFNNFKNIPDKNKEVDDYYVL